jgi:hypothetical protein
LSSHLLSKNLKIRIYKSIILPIVLYGCDTLSLTLREEHRLRVLENRMLRRMFRPKKDQMAVGCRKLCNKKLHNLRSSLSTRRMRWVGHGVENTTDRISMGKLEGKRPLGRPQGRWEDVIKLDLRETEWDGMDWIELDQDRVQYRALVNMVIKIQVS